ncbi:hypothetical protein ACGC1H_001931 [Rhizoctonia solani]|uniref:Zn(2)-C6 fungal-type domain-containing protein n=1 Tax=Rhizoctonia solani TaxID=456999 RepID=A0A8H3A6Y5_9AGAM|nr:unnamed protein product [Rhizoctonia solani]
MDQRVRIPPGPTGTSCLTCKRRHKKCDRSKPICERCSKGGHICLGYEPNKSNGCTDEPISSNSASWNSSRTSPQQSSSLVSSAVPHINEHSMGKESLGSNDMPTVPDTYNTNTNAMRLPGSPYEPQQDLSGPLACYNADAATYDTLHPNRHGTQATEAELLPLDHVTTPVVQQSTLTSTSLFTYASEIPRGVSITPSDVRNIVDYVISHFDRLRSTIYFAPQVRRFENTYTVTVWRLSTCAFARGAMLIDAKIRDSIIERSDYGHSNNFIRWIEEIEQTIYEQLDRPLVPYELRERLIDNLQLFFSKSMIIDATTAYQLFHRLAFKFLQIVNLTSSLCWAGHDSTSVSIAHLLTSPFYQCVNYIFMDIVGATVYGLPQVLAYNTEVDLFHTRLHPAEWVNCLPGEFLVLLAKINIRRDCRVEDWRDIEQWLVSWEPRPNFDPKELDSWKLVAWRALQEIWRQTLLIYLYLTICGMPTNDARIQSSLRQVFQLIGVIKRENPPIANAHIFVPVLIAGICSRTEKQRRLVRERLGCVTETQFWLFRNPRIVSVLDHLWLGVGAGGAPIRWNDYIHSRCTMLPLPG